jgi:DNA-binding NarL/FixJ family response regulator
MAGGARAEGLPPRIVGREAELGRVEAFVGALPHGARALVFRGEAGIGKTALWRHAVDRCRESGYVVLLSRPAEEEMPLALGGLLDLFEDAELDAAVLTDESNPIARGRIVLGEFRRSSTIRPTVVAVDDVQWLDPASARALRFALRRLHDEPVGVLAAVRVGSDQDDPLHTEWPLPSPRSEVVDLRALDLAALRRILSGTVSSIPRPMLRQIHEVSGGNPMYAIELARSMGARSRSRSATGRLPLPETLQGAIAERLAGVPTEIAPLLQLAAGLGRTSVGELERILPAADLEALLATAQRHEFLVLDADLAVRFAHPLIGSAVYASMSPLSRRSMHARLAELAVDPDDRARHLALSTDEAEAEIAGELEAAATRARDRGTFDLCADFASHSLRLTPQDQDADRYRRAMLEIDGRALGGEMSQALALVDRLIASLPPGPRRAEALLQRSYLEDEDMDSGETFLLQALAEAGSDASLRGTILDQLGWARGMIRGDLPGGLTYARESASIAERIGDPELQMLSGARAILSSLAGVRHPERFAWAVKLEAEHGKPAQWDSPRALQGEDLLWAGELAAARALFDAVYADIVRAGEELLRPYCLYDLALADCAAGNFDQAAELASEGIDAARDAEDTWAENLLLYPLALAQAWLGRDQTARATAARRLEESGRRGERPGIARARGVLGVLSLSEGAADAAVEELVPAVQLLEEMGFANPGAVPALPDAIEALAQSGDLARAGEYLIRLEEEAAALDCPWPAAAADRARGTVLLARGEVDGARAALERAATTFDRLGFRPDAARAVLANGRAALRSGRRTLARSILADARDRFTAMGAALWRARAMEELERSSPDRPSGTLTATERRVAALVAGGAKNRQIAETMFVSVPTVEAHLTRIYRKLDIRSRSELTRLVAEGAVEVGGSEGS